MEQLETVKRLVTLAGSSRSDLLRLRPLVREIVAARLSRRYGVDLEREPERAEALLGKGRAWELVRPDLRARRIATPLAGRGANWNNSSRNWRTSDGTTRHEISASSRSPRWGRGSRARSNGQWWASVTFSNWSCSGCSPMATCSSKTSRAWPRPSSPAPSPRPRR